MQEAGSREPVAGLALLAAQLLRVRAVGDRTPERAVREGMGHGTAFDQGASVPSIALRERGMTMAPWPAAVVTSAAARANERILATAGAEGVSVRCLF